MQNRSVRKFLTAAVMSLALPSLGFWGGGGGYKTGVDADDVEVDTSNFSGNLATCGGVPCDNAQKAFEELDAMLGGGGAFTDLTDTPGNYTGAGGLCAVVNAGETALEFSSCAGVGGGETNTASNVGTGDGQVFKEKSGVDLRFRRLIGGSNVSISTGTNDVTFSVANVNWDAAFSWGDHSLAGYLTGIDWSAVNSAEIQRAGINWDSFWVDAESGINWASIPGAVNGYVLKKTAAGINWQEDLQGGGGGSWGSITGTLSDQIDLQSALDGKAGTGDLHDPVTLAGTPDYITIAGQVITRALINLTSHVTGILPAANGGTGITSLGSGIATWLGTPSSANLAAAITDETGSGALVFATSPALVTPALGTPSSATLTNATGLPLTGLVNDTTTALGVGSINLGHASDTTVTRVAAGRVAVEGKGVCLDDGTDCPSELSIPAATKSVTIEEPTNAEDVTLFFTDQAITISKLAAVLVGSSTPSVTWTIRFADDRSAAGTEVVTSGTTTTSTTTGSIVTSFNNASIPADRWVWLKTTAKSGTVGSINVTMKYDLT